MSKVIKAFQFAGASPPLVFEKSLLTIKEMRGEDIKEEIVPEKNAKCVSATIPSIWGWGGMRLAVVVVPVEGGTRIVLDGYIAQLATSPLKNVMKTFMEGLSAALGLPFAEMPADINLLQSLNISPVQSKDKQMFLMVLLFTLVLPLLAVALFGRFIEILVFVAVLFVGYYFGKRYFYKR